MACDGPGAEGGRSCHAFRRRRGGARPGWPGRGGASAAGAGHRARCRDACHGATAGRPGSPGKRAPAGRVHLARAAVASLHALAVSTGLADAIGTSLLAPRTPGGRPSSRASTGHRPRRRPPPARHRGGHTARRRRGTRVGANAGAGRPEQRCVQGEGRDSTGNQHDATALARTVREAAPRPHRQASMAGKATLGVRAGTSLLGVACGGSSWTHGRGPGWSSIRRSCRGDHLPHLGQLVDPTMGRLAGARADRVCRVGARPAETAEPRSATPDSGACTSGMGATSGAGQRASGRRRRMPRRRAPVRSPWPPHTVSRSAETSRGSYPFGPAGRIRCPSQRSTRAAAGGIARPTSPRGAYPAAFTWRSCSLASFFRFAP